MQRELRLQSSQCACTGCELTVPEFELTRHPLTVRVAPRNEQMHAIFEGGAEFTDCPEETRVASVRLSIGRERPRTLGPLHSLHSLHRP